MKSPTSSTPATTQQEAETPVQLYRYDASIGPAHLLLEQDNLTDDDIRRFCAGDTDYLLPKRKNDETEAYRKRRVELFDLTQKLKRGRGARIDADGRLVAVPHPPPPPAADLPQPPPPRQPHQLPAVAADAEEGNDEWLRHQEEAATAAIARAVERYRERDVSFEKLELVPIQRQTQLLRRNLTFRRICMAVVAVLTAFLFIMIKTLPLFQKVERFDPRIDKLMMELLHVKQIATHARECPNLNRDQPMSLNWWLPGRLSKFWTRKYLDCSDGVLHIPSKKLLVSMIKRGVWENDDLDQTLSLRGVNASWFFPCRDPNYLSMVQKETKACSVEDAFRNESSCFRGVHDSLFTDREIRDIVSVGGSLIENGADHFDIQRDTLILHKQLSVVLSKIRDLLVDQYVFHGRIPTPVAFRIGAVGPIDAANVPLYGPRANYGIPRLLNRTNYIEWVERSQRRNDIAAYSLPWPFRIQPARDPCKLLADKEADPRFSIHTSLFLSEGAGEDFVGGVALYVDDHSTNRNPRKKIKRGIAVDGSRGRLVVSTGGMENRRCRLPTRAGIRAAFQVWWS